MVSKGYYKSIEDLGSKLNFVICSGTADFINKNKIIVVDLLTFITKYLPKI